MPLPIKEKFTEARIRSWYDHWKGKVYISFSGGKDSTVLLHQVRKIYPNVPAVFVDTGLEYPEIKDFVRTIDNVIWIKPKMSFRDVLSKYGYPVVSKMVAYRVSQFRNAKSARHKDMIINGNPEKGNACKLADKWHYLIDSDIKISSKCCDIMKKAPLKNFHRKTGLYPFVGTMACDSEPRKQAYLKNGCNAFDLKSPISTPLGFWVEADVWEYIRNREIPYSTIYDMGYDRTGCIFCMFGVLMEKGINNRFQKMYSTHPKLYDYCINKLGCGHALDVIGAEYKPQATLF